MATAVVKIDQVDRSILVIRGQKVMLDEHLAAFYGIETKRLIESVKRNIERFPADFMFQLTRDDWIALRSQNATSKTISRGGRRYPPYAFTEQGVAMLSSVVRSPRAIEVNIQIMRAFVRLRQLLSVHKELARRLAKLEQQMVKRDESVNQQFRQVFSLLEQLFEPPSPARKPIGFRAAD